MEKRIAITKNSNFGEFQTEAPQSVARVSVAGYNATIKLFGEIPEPDDPSILEIVDTLESQQFENIDVVINTFGGSWDTAIMLYSMLRAMQATTFVKTVGISSVYSAGIIVFMAGQERLASYYTDFLIHVTRIAMPYESSTNSMNYLNKHLGTVKRVIKDLFSDYLTEEEMRLVIDASSDLYLSEMEALERGIVTHAGFIYPQNYLLADLMPVQQNEGGETHGK